MVWAARAEGKYLAKFFARYGASPQAPRGRGLQGSRPRWSGVGPHTKRYELRSIVWLKEELVLRTKYEVDPHIWFFFKLSATRMEEVTVALFSRQIQAEIGAFAGLGTALISGLSLTARARQQA